MSFEFTNEGLSIQTYQEIYNELVSAYQSIYGADINTDADSPDGQRIGIEAKARHDMQAFLLALYNQTDPDFATGESLDRIIKLAGLSRRPPSRSQADVTVTTNTALTLPVGYAVEDDLGQRWIVATEVILVTGTNTVTLVSEDFASVEADANTITNPVDVLLGVVSVTNPLPATVGQDEETDPQLRIRRARSSATPGTSTLGGMFTALGEVAGVTDLIVYENDTNTFDPILQLKAHSIWAVVEGGEVVDIIETLTKNKTGGTGVKGSITGTFFETLTGPGGAPLTIAHEMAFDRPVTVEIFVRIQVQGIGGATPNVNAIRAAIAATEYTVAEVSNASELYRAVYSVAGEFTATDLEVSADGVTYTDDRLDPAPAEVFSIPSANITITTIL